jgi:hypothetical protein
MKVALLLPLLALPPAATTTTATRPSINIITTTGVSISI